MKKRKNETWLFSAENGDLGECASQLQDEINNFLRELATEERFEILSSSNTHTMGDDINDRGYEVKRHFMTATLLIAVGVREEE